MLKRSLERFEAAIPELMRALPLPLLAAWAVGYSLWALTHTQFLPQTITNTVPSDGRHTCLLFVGISIALVCAALAVRCAYKRLRPRPAAEQRSPKGALALLGLPLALPFAVTAFTPLIERNYPITSVVLILAAASGFTAFLFGLLSLGQRSSGCESVLSTMRCALERVDKKVPAALILLLLAGYTFYFFRASTRIVDGLQTTLWDLGIYDNLLYRTAHGDLLGSSLVRGNTHTTSHFDPILIALSPFYRMHPDVHFLLFFQSFWCGAGVIPVFLLGRHHLKSPWAGVVLAFVYALHPALHGANLNAFHSLTLVVPPVLLAFYFIETGRHLRFLFTLPFIWLMREDAALLSVFIGAGMLTAKGEKNRIVAGVLAILLSASYFVIVKRFFMASSEVFMKSPDAYDYSVVYKFMIPDHSGLKAFFVSILTNPIGVLRFAFDMEQLSFIFKMLGPLLFIPLFAHRGRLVLLYGFLFLLLSSHRPMHGTNVQYALVALPVLFGLLPSGMNRILHSRFVGELLTPSKRTFVLTGGLVFCSLLCSFRLGAIAENGNCIPFPRTSSALLPMRKAFIDKMVAQIPPKASVVASSKLLPFVSNRMNVFLFESHWTRPAAPVDYYFIDTVLQTEEEAKYYSKQINKIKKHYVVVASQHKITLYRRRPPTSALSVSNETLKEPRTNPESLSTSYGRR